MPPRHAYWTILVDEQPTAFRAADRDDLQPTFKRLQEKHPSARMVWFQNGKIWASRIEAQEAMRFRGQRGREGDVRQRHGERREGKLEWRPKQSPQIAPGFSRGRTASKPKLEWKPKGAPGTTQAPSPKPQAPRRRSAKREGGPVHRSAQREGGKLEWKPKGAPGTTQAPSPKPQAPRRKWIPKEEYKKSQGSRPPARDKKWRPGGEHRDPRQKYKDAKKAKWTRFKQNVRKRWDSKDTRKKKDDE